MNELQILATFHQALGTAKGLVIETDNPKAFQQKCYKVKREYGLSQPQLSALSFRISKVHPETQVWIMKNGNEEER